MQLRELLIFFSAATAAVAAPSNASPTATGKGPTGFKLNNNLQTTQSSVLVVVVGGSQLVYTPNSVTASPGQVVQFQFNSGNHTVTQADLNNPCQPLQITQPSAIHSGFISLNAASGTVGSFTMVVQSTDPIFLYSAAGNECQSQMVMAINAQQSQLLTFAAAAAQAETNQPAASVAGGIQANIPLANAAFLPAPAGAPAPQPSLVASTMSTVTVTTTVPPPGAAPASLPATSTQAPEVVINGTVPPTVTVLVTATVSE